MSVRLRHGLSKRERQMVEAIYARKQATAAEVMHAIPSPPSYSAVRATLQVLVRKGLLSTTREGRRYVYAPTIPPGEARRSVLRHMLDTYFEGSVTAAIAALIRVDRGQLSDGGYRSLRAMIEKEGREEKKR